MATRVVHKITLNCGWHSCQFILHFYSWSVAFICITSADLIQAFPAFQDSFQGGFLSFSRLCLLSVASCWSRSLCSVIRKPWHDSGVWFCVLSLVLCSRWNRGTRWTALRSSLTPHPTNWFSWTSCSPEQWCLARCEPPCSPSLMCSASSPSSSNLTSTPSNTPVACLGLTMTKH